MPAIRDHICFLLNDREVRLSDVGASATLLDHLRLDQALRGTKEGCAEGDCGACTVLVGRLVDGDVRYETVNACIRMLASVDGCHVVTVEHVATADGDLHPVQQALVARHGSQCGFCTPGIVMSLYALWMENPNPGETDIETALQGNLCRCTGYQPIVDAAKDAATTDTTHDPLIVERNRILTSLKAMRDGSRVIISNGADKAILPADVADLATVLLEHPDATIVAGSTDVGLWVTKFMREISPAVFIGHLDGLKTVNITDDDVTIGAGVTYSEFKQTIDSVFPQVSEYWRRIGGWQVRNMGTIGGNIANGSPIGDTPPVFIALDGEVILRRGDERRSVPLTDFFIAYGKQDREPGDFVEAIRLPRPDPDTLFAVYKISKRRDEDISSVCAAFAVTLKDGTVTEARLAYGGMAAIPKRAAHAEAALVGNTWTEEVIRSAMQAIATDLTPISDWRASAEYRALTAQNLLLRFYLETASSDEAVRLSA